MQVNQGNVLAAAVAAVSSPTSPVSVGSNGGGVMTSLMPAILDNGMGDAGGSNGLEWSRNNGDAGCVRQ